MVEFSVDSFFVFCLNLEIWFGVDLKEGEKLQCLCTSYVLGSVLVVLFVYF